MLLAFSMSAAYAEVVVLCYHDIVKNYTASSDKDSVSVAHFIQHLEALEKAGYKPLALKDLNKPVQDYLDKYYVLTFDDGYVSFYTEVYPILKYKNIPATLALVGEWLSEDGKPVIYNGVETPASNFVTKEQIKEMHESGLIEIASHSYGLHKGVLANPQGNMEPSATTRIYNENTKNYESDSEYFNRVISDLKKNQETLQAITGQAPETIVWPFGRYSPKLISELVKTLPIKRTLTLTEAPPNKSLLEIPRQFIRMDASAASMLKQIANKPQKPILRIMHVDLDYIYDPNPEQENKNLGALLDRVKDAGATAVFLQAFEDASGKGGVSHLYFPNRHLPVKQDLFNRVAWQLHTRTSARVFAWMPVLAFDIPNQPKIVQSNGELSDTYPRLTPYNQKNRQIISEIYEDLAKSTYISGVIFHDDALITDKEDYSEDAKAYFKDKPELSPMEKARIHGRTLNEFTLHLAKILQNYQMEFYTARNIYAQPVVNPASEEWFSQSLLDFSNTYDYTAIMAMPYMEKEAPAPFFKKLFANLRASKIPTHKIALEFQAKEWNSGKDISSEELNAWMFMSRTQGYSNFGYYPDDFIKGTPYLSGIKSNFSKNESLE